MNAQLFTITHVAMPPVPPGTPKTIKTAGPVVMQLAVRLPLVVRAFLLAAGLLCGAAPLGAQGIEWNAPSGGTTADPLSLTSIIGTTNCGGAAAAAANSVCLSANTITSEGATDNTSEFVLTFGDHTADNGLTILASSALSAVSIAPTSGGIAFIPTADTSYRVMAESLGGASSYSAYSASTRVIHMNYQGITMGSGGSIGLSSTTTSDAGGSRPTKLDRLADGVWRATSWIQQLGARSRVNADVTNATATMAAITGLTSTLLAGRKYTGEMVLFASDDVAADGLTLDFDGGTATMTSFAAQGTITDTVSTRNLARTAALATDLVDATTTGSAVVTIKLGFVVNAAGTFIPRFAQTAHTTGTATVTLNSFMWLEDTP